MAFGAGSARQFNSLPAPKNGIRQSGSPIHVEVRESCKAAFTFAPRTKFC
jgi:hypothetical protein